MRKNILTGIILFLQISGGLHAQTHTTLLDQIILTTVVPDSVIQGVPFNYYHELNGAFRNINKMVYSNSQVKGLDSLKTPERKLIDYYRVPSENNEKEIDFIKYALVNTNRATESGEVTIPSLHVTVDGKEYISEPATIRVIPNTEKPGANLTFTQQTPKRAFVDKEFRIEIQIDTYSGYFDGMKIDTEKFEKAFSTDFTIVDQKKLIDKRSEKASSIQAYSEYKWMLKPLKTGTVTLPPLYFTIEGRTYITDREEITILEIPDKEDVEVIHDKAVVLGNPVSLRIELKDSSWSLYEWELPDLILYGCSLPVPDEEEVLRRANGSGTYYFTPQQPGDITIPPIWLKTDKGEFYTDSIHIKVLPEDIHPIISTPDSIEKENVFTRFGLTKKRVYINEPILFVERIFSRLEMISPYPEMHILNWEGFYPDTKNRFDVSESFRKMNENNRIERINDRNYKIYDTRWTLLFVSELNGINPMDVRHIYTFRNPDEKGKNSKITWPIKGTVTFPLEVVPFPLENQPESFDGLVGDFSIHAELSGNLSTRNTPLSLIIQIKGKGNAHQLENNTLSFKSKDVEYELIHEDTRIKEITKEGIEAVKVYEYLVKADKKGKYTIPSIEVSYFDYAEEKYVTKRTSPISFKRK